MPGYEAGQRLCRSSEVWRRAGLALLFSALAACSDRLGAIAPAVQLAIEPTSVVLQQSEVVQLTAFARRDGAPWPGATVAWRSEAPAIATVTAAGQVIGVGIGSTRVFAAVGAVAAEARVTVLTACRVVGLIVVPATVRLQIGAQQQFAAAPACQENGAARFRWESSDTVVATVDTTGQVVGRGMGVAVIVARLATDSTRSAAARVEVTR